MLIWSPVAAAADEPADISTYKDKLELVTDGKGHYLAVIPFTMSDGEENGFLFYSGDGGKSFWAQRRTGGGRNGDQSFDSVFWEPRVGMIERWKASFGMKEGKYSVQCDTRNTPLTVVPKDEAAKIIGAAKWNKVRWTRRSHALARDNNGNYYYVDRARSPDNSKDFRVFRGPKGNVKLLKMTNIVSDSEGEIFITPAGKLKLILDKRETSWSAGKQTLKLTLLALEDNVAMIYNDLGVYAGEPLGTPCDDL